jgi:hypothetical protein
LCISAQGWYVAIIIALDEDTVAMGLEDIGVEKPNKERS